MASSIIEFISCSFKLEPPEIETVCFLPVVLSVALTSKRPLASISNATWTWGIPLGAGGIPDSLNLPSDLFSEAKGLSPCLTWTTTDDWLASEVLKTSDCLTGIGVYEEWVPS